jgi:hypothetical protein
MLVLRGRNKFLGTIYLFFFNFESNLASQEFPTFIEHEGSTQLPYRYLSHKQLSETFLHVLIPLLGLRIHPSQWVATWADGFSVHLLARKEAV